MTMPTMPRGLAGLAIVLPLVLGAGGAGAQTGVRDLGLSNEDFRIMREANRALYVDKEPEIGAETIWKNPDTGSFGTTEITGWDGRCVDMTLLIRIGGQRDNARFDWRVCRQDDGRWMNAPSPD